jgi:uncharacterized tellurite resistance protein B-like protein
MGGGLGSASGSALDFIASPKDVVEAILSWVGTPAVGIPLAISILLLVIGIGYLANRVGTQALQTGTIRKAHRMSEEASRQLSEWALRGLKDRDPRFSERSFLARTRTVFQAVQEALSSQDLAAVRCHLSAGVRERFEVRSVLQRAQGYRDRLEHVEFVSGEIAAVASDQFFDAIHVRVTGRAKNDRVDLKTGAVLRHNTDEPFTEYWTFMRRPGAKTLAKGGLVEGNCPSCGAALRLSDAGQCEYCRAVVTSGDHDWVLTKIIQENEWTGSGGPVRIRGYDALSSKDPAFCLIALEDRASVIFWRLVKTVFTRNLSAITGVAHPDYLAGLGDLFTLGGNRDWVVYHEAAVSAVEAREIAVNEVDGFDRVKVLVVWSARDATRGPDGAIAEAGECMLRTEYYTLVRKSDAPTPEKSSFRVAPCRGCGAPDEGTQMGICSSCGAPTNDGSRDWVLNSIGLFPASAFAASADPSQPAVAPAAVLAAMAKAMFADGVGDKAETALLQSFARKLGVPVEVLPQIIAAARSGASLPTPSSREEAQGMLEAMARTALADGSVTKEERQLLDRFGEWLWYSPADVGRILADEKLLLYRHSKEIIRNIRKGGAPSVTR